MRLLPDLVETVLPLNSGGLSTRGKWALLERRYRIGVSPEIIRHIAHEVLAERAPWKARPSESGLRLGRLRRDACEDP